MPRRILSCLVCFLSLLPLAGCGDGGGGDPPVKPDPSELGHGTPLDKILGPATWEQPGNMEPNCSYPADEHISSTGLQVVAIDGFDETGSGQVGDVYLQEVSDDPAPYSGITAFGSSFSPPDLRLFAGDVVDFLGTKEEFKGPSSGPFSYCETLPELQGTLTFRFDGTTAQKPKTIKTTDLFDYATGRQWLGMLVKVENVNLFAAKSSGSCPADLPTGCRYEAELVPDVPTMSTPPSIANELYDIKQRGPNLGAGTHFKSITGVVTYFYEFQIAPRSPEDFEL
jgi:hypothetical protein